MLNYINTTYTPSTNDNSLFLKGFGVGGVRSFYFSANREGAQKIHLVNVRSWELAKILDQYGMIKSSNDENIQFTYIPLSFDIKEDSGDDNDDNEDENDLQ